MDRGQGMDRRKGTETYTATQGQGQEQRDNNGETVTDRTGTG